MTINFKQDIDIGTAFIIGLLLGLLLNQRCDPEPRREDAKKPPVSDSDKVRAFPQGKAAQSA